MVEPLGETRLDVFARVPRVGWSVFGDEVEGSVVLPLSNKACSGRGTAPRR